MAEYTYGKDFAIRTEIDCIATKDVFGPYVGRITAVKIKTNGDRIRSMTDEELAEIISSLGNCDTCYLYLNRGCNINTSCKDAVLGWLRKEVEDG